jgi:hypothetical protein
MRKLLSISLIIALVAMFLVGVLPVLAVSLPATVTLKATNITYNSATINGNVTNDGGESCEARFRWRQKFGIVEDFTTYTEVDPNNHISLVGTNHIDFADWWNESAYLYKDFGVDHFGDFEQKIDWRPISCSAEDIAVNFWAVTNDIGSWAYLDNEGKTALGLAAQKQYEGTFELTLIELGAGQYTSIGSLPFSTWYYLLIKKVGTSFKCGVYSTAALRDTGDATDGDVGNLALTLYGDWKFRYLFPAISDNGSPSEHFDSEIENLDVGEGEWTLTDWQNTLETDDTYYEDLMDLESGTQYEFQAQVKNSAGEGEWSESAYFETTSPEITNLPDSYDFGILEVGTTAQTTISYFTLNNTGTCDISATIQGTDMEGGGFTWTLSGTATPGDMIYGLKVGLDDADDFFDVVVNTTANAFVTNLPASTSQAWGLKIWSPTSYDDGNLKTGNVTLTAVAS